MTAEILQELKTGLSIDCLAILPELILCTAIVVMLLVRLFSRFDGKHLGWTALVFTLYAVFVSICQWEGGRYNPREGASLAPLDVFGGMLVFDNFTIFIRIFLYGFTALVILLTLMTRIPAKEDSADFYCLLLGSAIGMSMMASANHLLMVLLGIEMASLPSYAMAGFLKGKRQSSEAALKYVVYGGGAAGVMLYGISLLAGRYGTAYIPDLALFMTQGPFDPLILLGCLFVLIGIAFKLAAVPFHFWCPDVFEGAPAEVAAYLSVASKGAALALLARLVMNLGGLATSEESDPEIWLRVVPYVVPSLAFLAALTTTFGNLAAYGQTNLKRLLAYSTIAHAGFMLMGLATLTPDGAGAVLFYLIAYLIMNLGAFAVVAFLRNLTGSEDLADFRGLVHRNPLVVVTLGVFLLSLLGIPPLAGFAAKFQIFSVLFDGAQVFASHHLTGLSYTMYALVVIAGLNTVLSLFYYVKVLRVMVLEPPLEVVENRPVEQLPTPLVPNIYLTLLAVLILGVGLFWNPLSQWSAEEGVVSFAHPPVPAKDKPVVTAQGVP